jgi:hypothetical protein
LYETVLGFLLRIFPTFLRGLEHMFYLLTLAPLSVNRAGRKSCLKNQAHLVFKHL